MRMLAAALAAGALLAAAGAVNANHSKPYEGTVQSVDAGANTITFEDGTTFRAAPGVELDGLDPGTRVIFYYHTYDGQKTVVSYEYADGAALSTKPAAGQ